MTGFVPARISIFKLAFSHKSNQATKDYAQTNNERLEYLGDAVLGTIVAEYLFKKYPNGDEGFLTKMRSKIVKRKSLNHIGDQMGLDVLLSEYNNTRLSSSMLGNAVEALVGAVYLEKGYRGTKRFIIQRMLKLYVDMHELETVDDNYKSQLLEYCQKNGMQINYKLLNKFKLDRRDRFKVAVMVNGEQISLADDFNKKSAEQLASLRALQKLGLIDKAAPAPTGRKSPSKQTFSEEQKPKKARTDRKSTPTKTPKQIPKSKTPAKGARAEKIALSTPSEAKPKAVRTAKPKLAEPKQQAKPKAPARKQKEIGAAMPARKQRRNNSRLGRSVWHGIQTAGAGIAVVDSMGYFENNDAHIISKPAPKKKPAKTSSIKSERADSKVPENGLVPMKASRTAEEKKPARRESASASTRKRRPIPLRLLTPIVKDASAVMAIDFAELFDKANSKNSNARPQQQKLARKPRRDSKAKADRPASEKASNDQAGSDASWEDTPLGLSPETAHAPKPNGRPKQKPKPKQDEVAATEQLDEWEDTLLEIQPEGNDLASNLPDMYKKSEAKAPVNRRRPQRRNTNRKKKTEE